MYFSIVISFRASATARMVLEVLGFVLSVLPSLNFLYTVYILN